MWILIIQKLFCEILLLFSCRVLSDPFATPWTSALETPLCITFSKQEYWNGLLFSFQGIFLTQEWNPHLLVGRQILYYLTTWKPFLNFKTNLILSTLYSYWVEMIITLTHCIIIWDYYQQKWNQEKESNCAESHSLGRY